VNVSLRLLSGIRYRITKNIYANLMWQSCCRFYAYFLYIFLDKVDLLYAALFSRVCVFSCL